MTTLPGFVPGDATGIACPAHAAALLEGGAPLLTGMFRAFGAIGPATAVSRIVSAGRCPGGSTGDKMFLTVDYAGPDAGLHRDLFVKFSRDFADPVRDARGSREMAGEIALAALSRDPAFPIRVPRAYFADIERASATGLLVTERIAFGRDGIEPHRPKCLDHGLQDASAHYRAIVRALARLAAAHRSGALPHVDRHFAFDPAAAAEALRVPFDDAALAERVRGWAGLVARASQLVPPAFAQPGFWPRFEAEARRFLRQQRAVARFLHADPSLVALCHWNANIDNAWFWRDAGGALECGLMDWGHAGQLNLAFVFWGCLSAAGRSTWDELDALLALFTGELRARGGPDLPVATLGLHLRLYIALAGLAYFLDSPARLLARLPDIADASGPRDPRIEAIETVRNQLHIATTFFRLWREHDFADALDQVPAGGISPPRRR